MLWEDGRETRLETQIFKKRLASIFQCKEQEGAELEIGFPGKLVCSSCQIRAGGTMLSQDEMTELFTADTQVPFGGTPATFFF